MSLYTELLAYGDQIELVQQMNGPAYVDWTEDNFEYVRYNPRKDINRWGLSITSYDGGTTGIPDLDSLYEYNKEHGTFFTEKSFRNQTLAYKYAPVANLISPWMGYIFRSHILKLGPGGFFPPHRDMRQSEIDSFRLIVPLKHTHPPEVNFVLEDKILHWKQGSLYFLNTAKMHYLFNASMEPSYWLVFNVDCNNYTVERLFEKMSQR